MGNEIIIAVTNELGHSRLGQSTKKIIDLSNGEIKNEKLKAVEIAKVANEKLYEKAGFKNVAEWSEKYINVNKSTVSRIVKAVNRFEADVNVWDSFTLSQMFEMYGESDKTLNEIGIKPSMSCKEIRAAIKAFNEQITVNTDEATEAEEATETEEVTTQEVTEAEEATEPIEIEEARTAELAATIRFYGKCNVEYVEATNEKPAHYIVTKI